MPRVGRYGNRLPDRIGTSAPPKLIAEFDRSAIVLRMIGSGIVLALVPFGSSLSSVSPVLFAGAMVMAPLALYGMLRGLSRLSQRHEIKASARGLSAAWSSAAFGLPFTVQQQAEIPWDDLLEVQSSTATLNGSTVNGSVHLSTKRGTVIVLTNDLTPGEAEIAKRVREAKSKHREYT